MRLALDDEVQAMWHCRVDRLRHTRAMSVRHEPWAQEGMVHVAPWYVLHVAGRVQAGAQSSRSTVAGTHLFEDITQLYACVFQNLSSVNQLQQNNRRHVDATADKEPDTGHRDCCLGAFTLPGRLPTSAT